ncbi:MAG: hypothetical protein NTV09_00625 [Bacteroidetes bacterium]|nr:hypothetical protein [Bacteroidota bacterium]
MKKIFLILLVLAAGSSSFAQSVNPKAVLDKSIEVNLSSTQMSLLTLDTLDQYYTRASNLTLYKSQDGGYVLGPALYYLGGGNIVPISKATASHFDGIGNAIIVEAWFIVGAKNIVGTADDVSVKIYDAGTDSVPTTLLDSVNLNVADMDTANGITVVPMAANITS